MRTLIIGGTGKVGSAVMASLKAMGVEAIAASRHPSGDGIALDMLDADAVRLVASGFDAVFFATPLGPDESTIGVNIVAALKQANVARIVYLGIMNLIAMREIPHFETKIPIRSAVLEAGGTVIEANFFFQNDVMMLPAMMHGGVYPMPVGTGGVWSVDTGDIGHAVARALTMNDWAGQTVPLCGPDRLTGPEMAKTWSEVLGRPVAYGGDAIPPFLGMLSQNIPNWGAWEANDFEVMMRVTQSHGCTATPADIAASETIVGRPLRRYRDFVNALAKGKHE
jgi:uncharacterized protein YbjT (DUF2867 family)